MTARELRRLHARLVNAEITLQAIHMADPCTEVSAAWGWVTKRRQQLEREIEDRAMPQRARKTRNGTRGEWAAVRRSVRGLDEGQLLTDGRTVADVIADEARARGLRT